MNLEVVCFAPLLRTCRPCDVIHTCVHEVRLCWVAPVLSNFFAILNSSKWRHLADIWLDCDNARVLTKTTHEMFCQYCCCRLICQLLLLLRFPTLRTFHELKGPRRAWFVLLTSSLWRLQSCVITNRKSRIHVLSGPRFRLAFRRRVSSWSSSRARHCGNQHAGYQGQYFEIFVLQINLVLMLAYIEVYLARETCSFFSWLPALLIRSWNAIEEC